jgi:hypothetical protein
MNTAHSNRSPFWLSQEYVLRNKFQVLDIYSVKDFGFWWSSAPFSDDKACEIDMDYNYTPLNRYTSFKINVFSVRCVKGLVTP